MRLITAELLRARSRRATWIILWGLVGLTLAFLGGNFATTTMPSAAETARSQEFFEDQLSDWEDNHEEWHANCVEEAALVGETPESWHCGDILVPPTLDDFTWAPSGFSERVTGETTGLLVLAAALMFVLGASLFAAEHSSGSLGNWLTFTPRRTPVFFSKLAAAAIVALAAAVVVAALSILGTAAWTELRGIPSRTPLDTAELTGAVLRSTGVVVAAGAIGAALGSLLRHTAAVIGAVAGYFVVVEMVFSGLFWRVNLHRFFLSTQLEAIIQGRASYDVQECRWSAEDGVQVCDSVERFVSAGEAAVFVGAVGLVVVVISWLVFRRRDVH